MSHGMKKSEPWLVPLSETVFIGYTDIAGAGSRALMGVTGTKERLMFEIPELENAKPCCKSTNESAGRSNQASKNVEKPLEPLMVFNCKYFQTSLVIINCHVSGKVAHALAKYLIKACSSSYVRKVVFLAALRLDVAEGPERPLYENVWNNCMPATNCPSLPGDTQICDSLLSNFIQMFIVEGMPFSCLIAPAHKAEPGKANEMDGSAQVINIMQEYVADLTHLGFSHATSCSLNYDGNPGPQADMVAMIYV